MIGRRARLLALVLLGLAAAWPPGPGLAAQLKVSPIRLILGPDNPVTVLTLGNSDSKPVLLHLSLKAWSHPNGEDRYLDTGDALVNPMIFELQPGEQQLVRVGLARPMPLERELSYRLFVRQVPKETQHTKRRITTLLNLSLPLFVEPAEALPPDLAWRVAPHSAGKVAVQVENKGNLHAVVSSIALNRQNGEQVASFDRRIYVLPGQRRELVVPSDQVGVAERLTLIAVSKRGRVETALRFGTVSPVEEALR